MGFLLALSILSSVVPVAHSASGAKQSILDEKTHQEVDLLAANALASAESVLPSLPQLPDFVDPRKSFEGLGDESFEGMGLAKKKKQGQGAGLNAKQEQATSSTHSNDEFGNMHFRAIEPPSTDDKKSAGDKKSNGKDDKNAKKDGKDGKNGKKSPEALSGLIDQYTIKLTDATGALRKLSDTVTREVVTSKTIRDIISNYRFKYIELLKDIRTKTSRIHELKGLVGQLYKNRLQQGIESALFSAQRDLQAVTSMSGFTDTDDAEMKQRITQLEDELRKIDTDNVLKTGLGVADAAAGKDGAKGGKPGDDKKAAGKGKGTEPKKSLFLEVESHVSKLLEVKGKQNQTAQNMDENEEQQAVSNSKLPPPSRRIPM